jgi:[acyl-carrier-protein] S-malonyltransferase
MEMSVGGKVACVFPGQGSQYVGMGQRLYAAFPRTRALLEEGSEVLGMDLKRLCLEGPEELLVLTANTQPAILAVSTMAWVILKDQGISPDFVAGHSLGEYSALVAADALKYVDALRAVRRRGELMQEAVAVGAGAMAAIIGLSSEEVEEVCREAAQGEVVEVANLNAPVQTVVAGHKTAVDRAMAVAKARGAKRVQPLPVSAPFHCRLIRPIAQEFAQVLASLEIRDPRIPLIATRDAEPKETAAAVIQSLVEQLSHPVRWVEVVRRLIQEGVQTFIEVGPGKILSGLIKRIDGGVKVCQVEDPESLEEALTLFVRV